MKRLLKRSKYRVFAGKLYFLSKAHIYWYLSNVDFANIKSEKNYQLKYLRIKQSYLEN